MNIGMSLILSAALAAGSTIGAAALGQSSLRESQVEVLPSPEGDASPRVDIEAVDSDVDAREKGVRSELLAAAEAGEISWEAAHRVGEDLSSYIRGERSADAS